MQQVNETEQTNTWQPNCISKLNQSNGLLHHSNKNMSVLSPVYKPWGPQASQF